MVLKGKETPQWVIEFQSVYKLHQALQLYYSTVQATNAQPEIRVYQFTWNMARDPQNIDFSQLVPKPWEYNLIVWSAQECERTKAPEWIRKMAEYLGSDFL